MSLHFILLHCVGLRNTQYKSHSIAALLACGQEETLGSHRGEEGVHHPEWGNKIIWLPTTNPPLPITKVPPSPPSPSLLPSPTETWYKEDTPDATYIRMFYKYEAAGEANPLDTTTVSWLPPQRQFFRIILIYFAMSLSYIHTTPHKINTFWIDVCHYI